MTKFKIVMGVILLLLSAIIVISMKAAIELWEIQSYPWKKEIREEQVTKEEEKKFLAVALNDSRVREILKGRNFSVSMVKYVIYAGGEKGRDPDSVHITFRVDSETYQVILLSHNGKLEVGRIEKVKKI